MLQTLREKSSSKIAQLLFGLLILSFAVWGMGNPFGGAAPDVVASVGKDAVGASQLYNRVRGEVNRLQQMTGTTITLEKAHEIGLVDRELQQLIRDKLFTLEAQSMGLNVPEHYLVELIKGVPEFQKDGAFDAATYQMVLQQNRLTEPQYLALLQQDNARAQLMQTMFARSYVPQDVGVYVYQYLEEKRMADVVPFNVDDYTSRVSVTDEEMENYYTDHQDQFMTEAYRGFAMMIIGAEQVAKNIQVDEAKLKEEYETRSAQWQKPEQREVEQILFTSEESAKKAYEKIQQGTALVDISRQFDGTSVVSLGMVHKDALIPELAEVAFELPQGKISAPVQSSLGWHVLKIHKIEPAHVVAFEDVKNELRDDVMAQMAADQLYESGVQIEDQLAGGASLAEVASEYNLAVHKVAPVSPQGKLENGQSFIRQLPSLSDVSENEILKEVFALDEGQDSGLIETSDGKYYVIQVNKVIASTPKALSTVKDEVKQALKREKAQEKINELAQTLLKNATDKNLKSVALDYDYEVRTQPGLIRNNQKIDPNLAKAVFDQKIGESAMVSMPYGVAVVSPTKRDVPERPDAQTLKNISKQVDQYVTRDYTQIFYDALKNKHGVLIYPENIAQVFTRL